MGATPMTRPPGDPANDGAEDWEPVFAQEGTNVLLRCFDKTGGFNGDLRIARAETEGFAHTLVSAANAGMRYMQTVVIDRAVDKILGESGEGTTG